MPQMIYDMPMSDYLALDALSASSIVKVLRSLLHWKKSVKKDSAAFDIGEAFHKLLLEGTSAFLDSYCIWGGDKRGKEWTSFAAEHADKTILKTEEYSIICGMSESVMAHPIASGLVRNGRPEVTVLWNEDGVPSKARLDYYKCDGGCIVELKSTRDAAIEAFTRQSYTLGYYIKYRWYQRGVMADTGRELPVFVITTENVAPFDTVVYQVDQDSMDYADTKIEEALEVVRLAKETGKYPGISNKLETLSLPPWVKTKQTTKLIINGEEIEL